MPRISPALAWVRPRSLMILYICSVRRAFSSSCSACGRSRSAKTLLLPCSARILLFFSMLSSAFPCSVAGRPPAAGGSNRCPSAASLCPFSISSGMREGRRSAGELHGVDRPVRVRVVPVDDLHHVGASEALQRFGRGIGFALLRGVERLAYIPADLLWEVA